MESVVADSETLCMDGDIDLNDLDYTKFDSAASAFLEQNLVEFEGEGEEEDIVQQNERDKDNYDLEATIRGVFYDDDDDDEETEIPMPFSYQSSYENYEPTFANFNQHTQSPLSHQKDQSTQTTTAFTHTHISMKHKPRKPRYKNYSKEDMMMAVNKLRKGKTAWEVHKIFPNIPSRTLYERAKRLGIVSNYAKNIMIKRTFNNTNTNKDLEPNLNDPQYADAEMFPELIIDIDDTDDSEAQTEHGHSIFGCSQLNQSEAEADLPAPGTRPRCSGMGDPRSPQGGSQHFPGQQDMSIHGKRANRTRFSDYQVKVLQEFFEKNAYPKADDLEYLSKLLGLTPRVTHE